MQATEWDRRLVVRADGRNLAGHAGVVLLRKVADRVGLTRALTGALPQGIGPGWRDRGMVLVQLACAIALGARNILEAEQLQYHWRPLLPRPVSDSTLRRTLQAIDGPVAARVERVRSAIRRVVWTMLALRPGGFPWISVCGRELANWYVLDLDATIVTCASRKDGAAGTFKGSFGHHPLGAWVANTRECVAMLLRPGNAAANDVADHKVRRFGRAAGSDPAGFLLVMRGMAPVVPSQANPPKRGVSPKADRDGATPCSSTCRR